MDAKSPVEPEIVIPPKPKSDFRQPVPPPDPFAVVACTDPKWADAAHTAINCQVTFAKFGKPLEFIAMANDSENHGQSLYANLVAGKYGPIADYVAPASPKALTPSTGTNKV
jgi:hypothetical protein